MAQLQLSYLFQDKPCPPAAEPADYASLDILIDGCHLYGEIMWPDGSFDLPRPCVVMFHGFPGSARNDDIAHALCRIGCVVLVPHHRGAWGSQGDYLVSNCISDALHLAEYVRSTPFCRQYRTDPGAVFFLGHSMGGNTVLNAARQLDWLRGIILLTPFDPTRPLRAGAAQKLRDLLRQSELLHSQGPAAIYADILAHEHQFCHENAFAELKDQNVFCATGEFDSCAPGTAMFGPLWELLRQHNTCAIQRWRIYPAAHGLLGVRNALIRDIAAFLSDVLAS